jgi:superfamily II DNA or RNA helicase
MTLIEIKAGKNIQRQFTTGNQFSNPNDVVSSWHNAIRLREENLIENVLGLRNPQLGGIYAAMSHWTHSNEVATIVMPTGTGKTETMLSLMIQRMICKLLVIVPTDALREQIAAKFQTLGILKDVIKVVDESALHPVVGILKAKFSNLEESEKFIKTSNVIVATAKILSGLPPDILDVLVNEVSDVFIDEAHHSEARTWFDLREKFEAKRVLQFTATPYREDGKHPAKKIIFDYPLKRAQAEGYFKQIEYKPVWQWDEKLADEAIANEAVRILKEDKANGFPHILLARVQTKKRADKVFEIYKAFEEFRVEKIYSGISKEAEIRKAITQKSVDIVVCVDMLGEGFDLPELKIAAFHDVKKSLPTTIQLVGRFTRTSVDENLGTAKVVVNLSGINVKDELESLYAQDNDWNELLPQISESRTGREKDFQDLISGFENVEDFVVSLSSLKPAMSTVIYRNVDRQWKPENFEKGLGRRLSHELITQPVINDKKKVFVVVTAEKVFHKWTDNLDIFDRSWRFYLFHWNVEKNLLFIHSSVNDSLHRNLARAVIGENAQIIDGENNGEIFRCLDGLQMFKLQNIGFKELLGRLIRFRMSVGTDIEPALSEAEINKAKKSHVFGVGFENGKLTTMGCSFKGRIWSQLKDDIDCFINWCDNVGRKVLDENIDAEQVLRGAIVPKSISERPAVVPICIDWNDDMYKNLELHYQFQIGEDEYKFYESELVLIEPSIDGNIRFGVENNGAIIAEFELQMFKAKTFNDFRIVKNLPANDIHISCGIRGKSEKLESFFEENPPEIWFADGSLQEGCSLSKIEDNKKPYDVAKITSWDWIGVDFAKESQGVEPKVTDSIQYYCIQKLKGEDYDIIYDDDGSGEIADVIAFKKTANKIRVELYHLKFAKYTKSTKLLNLEDREVSTAIANLYEVCGQAQKSVRWKFKDSKEFYGRLFKRMTKKYKGKEGLRLETGTDAKLKELMALSRLTLPLEFKVYIVQPAIKISGMDQQKLELLAVTEHFLKAKGIDLEVIGSI